jgi:hypothetical protein
MRDLRKGTQDLDDCFFLKKIFFWDFCTKKCFCLVPGSGIGSGTGSTVGSAVGSAVGSEIKQKLSQI